MTKQLRLLTMQACGNAFMATASIADLPSNSPTDSDFDVYGITIRSSSTTVFYQITSGKHGSSIILLQHSHALE